MPHHLLLGRFLQDDRVHEGRGNAAVCLHRVSPGPDDLPGRGPVDQGSAAEGRGETLRDTVLPEER